jgi:hypothetical protein
VTGGAIRRSRKTGKLVQEDCFLDRVLCRPVEREAVAIQGFVTIETVKALGLKAKAHIDIRQQGKMRG